MNATHFTKTETLKRLRTIAHEARLRTQLPRNARVEVGLRCVPLVIVDPIAAESFYADGDDLEEQLDFSWAARESSVQQHGALVHLYFSVRDGFDGEFELREIVVGWMGDDEHAAQLVDVNGVRIVERAS